MSATNNGSEQPGSKRGRWSKADQARLKQLYGLRSEKAIARELHRSVVGVIRMASKLIPLAEKRDRWTARETIELKRYLGASTADVIARVLGRSVEEVRAQILDLGRVQRDDGWTRFEIRHLKHLYGTRTDEDLALIFARTVEDIRRVAKEQRLSKDKAFLHRLNGKTATRMPRWTDEELRILEKHYASLSNLEIARLLDRSVKSVISKAHHLGLEKSPARLRVMGRDNVRVRYLVT